jgi:type IV pilus assembly protein PilV
MDMTITKQHAFSLIEVLVSIVVIAIGLLGVAKIQANAIRYNHDAVLRAIATIQSNNMLDRLYANQVASSTGQYNALVGIPSRPICTICSSQQIAQMDVHDWNTENAALLPNGQGSVIKNGNITRIIVRYDKDKTGATGLNCSQNTNLDLSCVILEVVL